ncbi:nucleoside triphosphate pyrophosphohydrolase family protein [Turicimonas sp. TL08]
MNKELETKLKTIADHYGLEIQSIKLSEEAAEFCASLIKVVGFDRLSFDEFIKDGKNEGYFDRLSDEAREKMVEELVDVIVVAEQVKYLLEKEPEFKTIERLMTEKVNRQLTRIEQEKNHGK